MVQWRQRSKLLLFLFITHQKECHHFLLFLDTHKLQMNRTNFALMVVEACEMAAMKYGNSILLNELTYDVACEVKLNKTLTL